MEADNKALRDALALINLPKGHQTEKDLIVSNRRVSLRSNKEKTLTINDEINPNDSAGLNTNTSLRSMGNKKRKEAPVTTSPALSQIKMTKLDNGPDVNQVIIEALFVNESKNRGVYREEKLKSESADNPAITTVSPSILNNKNITLGFFGSCVNLVQYLEAFTSTVNEDGVVTYNNSKQKMEKSYLDLKKKIRTVVEFDRNLWQKYVNKDYGKRNIAQETSVPEVNQKFPMYLVILTRNRDTKQMESRPWFMIKKSTLKSAGPRTKQIRLGVFAATDFQAYQCLGLYMGMMKDGKESYTKYSATSAFGNIDGRNSFVTGNGHYNYAMGIQEVNDPTVDTRDEASVAEAKVNTIMTDDLLLYSTKIIEEGDEIFLKYKCSK